MSGRHALAQEVVNQAWHALRRMNERHAAVWHTLTPEQQAKARHNRDLLRASLERAQAEEQAAHQAAYPECYRVSTMNYPR